MISEHLLCFPTRSLNFDDMGNLLVGFVVEDYAGIFDIGDAADFELIHPLDQLGVLLLVKVQLQHKLALSG